MANLVHALYALRQMDDLSRCRSVVHRLHPLAKVMATLLYLVALASFGRHETVRLLPYALYPVVLAAAGGIPARPILKRLLYAEPLIIGIGLLNPLFDRGTVPVGGWLVGAGWLVFASIVIKATLGMAAALVLMAVTGMDGIAAALRMLGVPGLFILQLQLVYRYLTLLVEEGARTVSAHALRAGGGRGLRPGTWGPLLGQLLLRTIDRAQRVYDAMLLRGFAGRHHAKPAGRFGLTDAAFAAGWIGLFLLFRSADVPRWLGAMAMGGRP